MSALLPGKWDIVCLRCFYFCHEFWLDIHVPTDKATILFFRFPQLCQTAINHHFFVGCHSFAKSGHTVAKSFFPFINLVMVTFPPEMIDVPYTFCP